MRKETDALGEMDIPDEAYYGIQTIRNSRNYSVSPHTYCEYMEIVKAVAEVKKACAITNAQIGALDPRKSAAIQQAADELIAGRFDDQFPINIWRSQGTGVNMNVNEVIANRANEILTGHKGRDEIHPNTHVNMCQSSNDVFPTAENIVFFRNIAKTTAALKHLEDAVAKKAIEFKDVVRLGRTGLQDAVPMTWGQVFGTWHSMLHRNRVELESYRPTFQSVVLGATVLGTGMGQLPGYADHIYENLSKVIGFEVYWPRMDGEVIEDSAAFDGMRNTDHQMMLMCYLKSAAAALGRIANDLIIFSSGPTAGLRELELPESAIGTLGYEGENTPYVPELVLQVMSQIIGTEFMALLSANEGQQDHGSVNSGAVIKVYQALRLMEKLPFIFSDECISGIRVNREVCQKNAELSTSLSTMVGSLFGYPTGVKVAKLASAEGISCKEAALREHLIPEDAAQEIFDVRKLADRHATVAMFEKYRGLRKIS